MQDDETRQTNRQEQTIYNRQYITDDEQWDNNDIDFEQDTMNNEKWWILKYDKFWRQYNTMNVIDDDDSNNFQ